jgi:hypothetical protein
MNITELKEIEIGVVRTLQGGRIDYVTNTSIQWAPYTHGCIGLYTGTSWVPVTKSGSVTYNIADKDYFGNSVTAGLNYDVFAKYLSSGNFNLQLVPWATNNTRVTDLNRFEGILVYDNSAAGRIMRYLGTVRLVAGPYFVDSDTQRFMINYNNQIPKGLRAYCSSTPYATWNPTSVNIVEYYTGTNMVRGEFLCLDPAFYLTGGVTAWYTATTSVVTARGQIAVALNTTTSGLPFWGEWNEVNTGNYQIRYSTPTVAYGLPLLGYNYFTIVFRAVVAATYQTYSEPGKYTAAFMNIMG